MTSRSNLIPPLQHALDFFQDFTSFLLPLIVLLTVILFVAAFLLHIYKLVFGRYATPEELYNEATSLLKRDGDTINSESRKLALDNLRLVIQLKPESIKGYVVLSKELLYGDINDGTNAKNQRQTMHNVKCRSVRQRQSLMQQLDNTTSPAIVECKETIRKGLLIDPKNESLLKLQSELDLVMKYGRNNVQTRMMNVGSFGWNGG